MMVVARRRAENRARRTSLAIAKMVLVFRLCVKCVVQVVALHNLYTKHKCLKATHVNGKKICLIITAKHKIKATCLQAKLR